jgi:hypothetical protein
MHSVCVVELHATVSYTKILCVAQNCFYGKYMSLVTMQIIRTSFLKQIILQLICSLFRHYIYAVY